MKIELSEPEIKTALISYIGTQGINLEGKNVSVELTAGRGPNGHSASINIDADEAGTTLASVPAITPDKTDEALAPAPVAVDTEDDKTTTASKPLFGKQ